MAGTIELILKALDVGFERCKLFTLPASTAQQNTNPAPGSQIGAVPSGNVW